MKTEDAVPDTDAPVILIIDSEADSSHTVEELVARYSRDYTIVADPDVVAAGKRLRDRSHRSGRRHSDRTRAERRRHPLLDQRLVDSVHQQRQGAQARRFGSVGELLQAAWNTPDVEVLNSNPVLAVHDLEQSAAWYREVLGCETRDPDPGNWRFCRSDEFQEGVESQEP